MATVDECEVALHTLAERLAGYRDAKGDDHSTPDRTISCTVRDLDVVFLARLERGRLVAIRRVTATGNHAKTDTRTGTATSIRADAQIRFDLIGDDLLGLVDGTLDVASAWVTGRLKVGAGFRDLIRLRSFL